MQEFTRLPVTLTGVQGESTSGYVDLKVWQKKERGLRGLKALGICWGLAVAAVFLPILHFFLVPLLFLAGPFMYLWISSQDQVILGGQGECPVCKKSLEIARSPVKWPLSDLCNHCQASLKIDKV